MDDQAADESDRRDEAVLVTRPLPPVPGLPELVAQGVQVGFGVTAVVLEIVLRSIGWSAGSRPTGASTVTVTGTGESATVQPPVTDVALGLAWTVSGWAGRAAAATASLATPVIEVLATPPLVPRPLQPATWAAGLAATWEQQRPDAVVALDNAVSAAVPLSTQAVLERIDLDAVVRAVLQRLDLQLVVTDALRELDLDAVVADALGQLDLPAVVDAAVQRIDLTQVVIDNVDLGPVVTAALDQIDLDEIVMDRVDVLGLADYVVQGIDLPEIIRMSTGSVASEAVRTVRLQGVDADRAVAVLVDKFMLRRRARATDAPGEPQSLSDQS
jgi:hypothetical protein